MGHRTAKHDPFRSQNRHAFHPSTNCLLWCTAITDKLQYM